MLLCNDGAAKMQCVDDYMLAVENFRALLLALSIFEHAFEQAKHLEQTQTIDRLAQLHTGQNATKGQSQASRLQRGALAVTAR